MAAIPYALSISHLTSSVGADAGFAALVGLAILILLYFAQARETASLRDRFAEASEQVRRLELQVAHLARPQAASRPEVAPRPAAAAQAPVPSRTARPLPVSEVPMAPAGVGAPALSAATRVVPSGDQGAISIRPGAARVAVGAATGAGAARAEGGASASSPGASGGGVIAPPAPPTGPAAPSPATAAGAGVASGGRGNGAGAAGGRTPAPAPAAGVGAPSRPGQDPGRPYRIAGARPAGQGAQRPPLAPPPDERSGSRRTLMIIGGLLVVAAVVAGLVVLTSSSGTPANRSQSTPASTNAPQSTHRRRVALAPGQVTVAVLNGTSTTNLAHDVSLKLASAGYRQGTIATATDQTQTATTVGYMPGQRRAALLVARSLNLGPAAVVSVTAPNRAVACPQASCPAQVVVTVGTDLAGIANSSSAAPGPAAASTTT